MVSIVVNTNHVDMLLTGDLSIIKDAKLRNLLSNI